MSAIIGKVLKTTVLMWCIWFIWCWWVVRHCSHGCMFLIGRWWWRLKGEL